MALRLRDNALSQGSENATVSSKSVVMGTQATANVTTRRRLADVSNINGAGIVESSKHGQARDARAGRKRTRASPSAMRVWADDSMESVVKPTEVAKPTLGLKKSLATRNLLAPLKVEETKPSKASAAAASATAVTVKQDAASAVVRKEQEAYSVHSLSTFVEDIDIVDGDNPQLCAEYVKDIYVYLRRLEREYAVAEDYLAAKPGAKVKPEINAKMRTILVDWLIQVHQRFSLLQETLYLTVAILDRYLQVRCEVVKRKKLQLVGVTCMWIASKYEEMYAPEINDFVYITDNAYNSAEIRQMELDVLRQLDFNLGKPLPLHFLRRNSKAAGVDATQHNFAKFFMEITLQEYAFVHVSPSQLAAAALCLSCRVVNEDFAKNGGDVEKLKWEDKMVHYSGYKESELAKLISLIASFVVKSETSKLNYVKQKYQSSKFLRISSSPLLKTEAFLQIAGGK